jgi:hypothetical protein
MTPLRARHLATEPRTAMPRAKRRISHISTREELGEGL